MAGGTVKCFLCKATVSRVMKVVSSTGCYVTQFSHKFFPNATNTWKGHVSSITKSMVETTILI